LVPLSSDETGSAAIVTVITIVPVALMLPAVPVISTLLVIASSLLLRSGLRRLLLIRYYGATSGSGLR